MKDIALKNITILLLLVYLVMQLLCIAPITRISQIVFVVWFLFAYAAYTPIVRKTLSSKVVGTLVVFLLYYGLSLLFSHDVLYSISAVLSMLEMFSPLLMYNILKDDTKKQKQLFLYVFHLFLFLILFHVIHISIILLRQVDCAILNCLQIIRILSLFYIQSCYWFHLLFTICRN